MTEDTCIYCQQVVAIQRGEGDHVIPAALGRFNGEFRFRRICRECNSRIGTCEQQLLQCAPEASLRRMVQPQVKRKKRGMSWVGANGMPSPKVTVDHGDHSELVEAEAMNPRSIRPVDQLVIVDKEMGENHIRLFPDMGLAQLRARFDALGISASARIHLHADEGTWPKYKELLNELRPDWSFAETEGFEPGEHSVKGRTKFVFHTDYWRAIAKIGFHYYLCNSRRGVVGNEPEFGDIRRFIIEGGEREEFFNKPAARFELPFGELSDGRAILSQTWAHVLAADETCGNAVAMVCLFMGPERLAPTYHIYLGRFKSELVVPDARYAHTYKYFAKPTTGPHAGQVVRLSLTRLS